MRIVYSSVSDVLSCDEISSHCGVGPSAGLSSSESVSPVAWLIYAIYRLSLVQSFCKSAELRLHSTVKEDWNRKMVEWVSLGQQSRRHYTQTISPFAGFVDAVDWLANTKTITPFAGFVDAVDWLTFIKTTAVAFQFFEKPSESLFAVVIVIADVTCISPGCSLGSVAVPTNNDDWMFRGFLLCVRSLRHTAVEEFTHRRLMLGTRRRYVVISKREFTWSSR